MNTPRGFTLIELLVVIAIIGLLSSVVLASLSNARLQARDASIRASVAQLVLLLEMEFNISGSYANLNPGWIGGGNCNATFSGTLASNARAICNKIINDSGVSLYVGTAAGGTTANSFSILAYLPSNGRTACATHTGARSNTCVWGDWSCSGCFSNP